VVGVNVFPKLSRSPRFLSKAEGGYVSRIDDSFEAVHFRREV
jgi:hypothetical protein